LAGPDLAGGRPGANQNNRRYEDGGAVVAEGDGVREVVFPSHWRRGMRRGLCPLPRKKLKLLPLNGILCILALYY